MDNNLDQVAKDLYGKIQTRFPKIKLGDENAEVLSKKSDIPKARFFEFEFEIQDEPIGTIAITLDPDDGLIVQLSDELTHLSENSTSIDDNLCSFIRSFRVFAKKRLLNFDVQNIGKSNLDKRDYNFRAKSKELSMMESKMYGTSRMSYQDLGEAKLVVKHNKPVNPSIAAGRSMNIESIYIENSEGERFKYPYKHLHGARAIAEHIKHGGTPYDPIGRHIVGLSEELAQLRKFKNYVGRQTQLSEAMGTITDKVIDRIEEVKKEVQQLQRKSFYEQFAESFQEKSDQEIPETIMNDWVDRLTVRSFNEDIKQVFPYLYNIVETSSLPVRELDASDFDEMLSESMVHKSKTQGFNPSRMIESFMNRIVMEEKNELFSPNPSLRNRAINDLNDKLRTELVGGTAGVLALKGIIDEKELTQQIAVLDSDADVRDAIKTYLLNDEVGRKVIPSLTNLDTKSPEEIGGSAPIGGSEFAPGGEVPSELPPAPGGEMPPAPGGELPPELPPAPGGEMPPAPGAPVPPPAGAPVPPAPIAENIKMRAKFIKAKAAGATLDTMIAEGVTIRDAIKECGLDNAECGYAEEEPSRTSGMDELLKIISGFWNAAEKNFTIGGTRAKIKVVKAFQDGECPSATEDDVKKALIFITKKDPSTDASVEPTSMGDIDADNREKHMFDKMIYMQEEPVMESELDAIRRIAGIYK